MTREQFYKGLGPAWDLCSSAGARMIRRLAPLIYITLTHRHHANELGQAFQKLQRTKHRSRFFQRVMVHHVWQCCVCVWSGTTGRIDQVNEGHGKVLGVQIGWIIYRIDGSAFNDALLQRKIHGETPYKLTFDRSEAWVRRDCCYWIILAHAVIHAPVAVCKYWKSFVIPKHFASVDVV